MRKLLNQLKPLCRISFGLVFCLITFIGRAQHSPSDSMRVSGSSMVLKMRPLAALLNLPNLAIEQTIGRRSSVSLTAFHSVLFFRDLRAMGESRGVSVAYSYYPLAKEMAPAGWYVGPKISYSHLQNSSLLRVLSLFDSSGEASLLSAQAVVGYQLCLRSNLVLDTQANLGFLHNLKYYRYSGSGQSISSTIVNQTQFGLLPSVHVSVGYRFRQK